MEQHWRTRASFTGDDWHELRDAQHARRDQVVAALAGRVADVYQRCAVATGRTDEPLARLVRAQRVFHPRALYPTHDWLAAFWRARHGHLVPTLPGMVILDPMVRDWHRWAVQEVMRWLLHWPDLVRTYARALAAARVSGVESEEIDLWDELRPRYPLPPHPPPPPPRPAAADPPDVDYQGFEPQWACDPAGPAPAFPGDEWASMREEQYFYRHDTAAKVVRQVALAYRRATVVVGGGDDPVGSVLFDGRGLPLRAVMQAHAHLAAFWRLTNADNPPKPRLWEDGPIKAWQEWIVAEATAWIWDNPLLLRGFAVLLATAGSPAALDAERALWDELRIYYPLPLSDCLDLFDRRGAAD
jgi:hypothetical protein